MCPKVRCSCNILDLCVCAEGTALGRVASYAVALHVAIKSAGLHMEKFRDDAHESERNSAEGAPSALQRYCDAG